MSAKLAEISDRIQKFQVHFIKDAASPDDITDILDILGELVEEVRRIEAASIAACKNINQV